MAVDNYTIDDITQHVQNVIGEMFKQISNFAGLIVLGAIVGIIFDGLKGFPLLGKVWRR